MWLIFFATLVLLALSLLLSLVLMGWSKKRRSKEGFWRRLLVWQALLLPVYVFGLLPALMGYVGSQLVRTRGDESGYLGPRIRPDGEWCIQTRGALLAAQDLSEAELEAIRRRTILFRATDGHRLRGFIVPRQKGPPRASVVLVHGLFRGGMELEPVANMFRELGCEVLMLELTNHGGSDKRGFTYGLKEQHDVIAAVTYLRERKGGLQAPLVLFGVSLGGIAVALAAPQIPEVAGVVLDAPMTELMGTTRRHMEDVFGLPSFFVSITLWHLQWWSDFDIEGVRPIDSYRRFAPDLPVLFVGGGLDRRVPPAVVTASFEALPAPQGVKELWIEKGAKHGKACIDQPEKYRQHLAALLDRIAK